MFQSAERISSTTPEFGGPGTVPFADVLQLSQLGGANELLVDPAAEPVSSVDISAHAQRRTRPWRAAYVTSLVAADGVAAAVVMTCARLTDSSAPWWYLLLLLSWPALVIAAGAYGSQFAAVGLEESACVVKAAVGLLALLVGAAWLAQVQVSRGTPLLVSAAVMTLGLLQRSIVRRLLYRLRAGGRCQVRVLAVGNDQSIDSLQEQAAYDTQAGLEVVAACAMAGPAGTVQPSARLRVLHQPSDLRAAVVQAGADLVTFTPCPGLDGQAIRRLAWQLEGLPVTVAIVPEIREVAASRLHARHISGLAVITIDQPALRGFRRVVKHALDRIAALLLLLVLAPVMLLVALTGRHCSGRRVSAATARSRA